MVDQSTLNILWVLLCACLVFVMQAGFLCLETGLTRSKNSINVALKNLTDFGIAVLLFWLIGYGLMFGTSTGGWVGSSDFAANISQTDWWPATFFFFQVMFCGTAVTILAGAVAERMRFGAYIITAAIVSGLIYPLFGHWTWNGLDSGSSAGWLGALGFVDFAGSTVVHSVGGWVALATLLVIGPRAGRFPEDGPPRRIPGSNLPLATLGVLLLWFGWFGFNGGSTLALNAQVAQIIVNTTLAGAAGLATTLLWAWRTRGLAEVGWSLNGAVAGLVAITANCHVVSTPSAVIIGAVGGFVMMLADSLLERLHIDDAVGAIPVHLAAGVWGTLAVALFGQADLLGTGLPRAQQLMVQTVGIVACGVWSFGAAYVALRVVQRFFSLRVTSADEHVGLNVSEHNATTELIDLFTAMEQQSHTQDLSLRMPVEPFTEVGQIANRYNRVMDALEQAVARTDAIVRTAVDGIITFSRPDLKITSLNPAAEQMCGYPPEQLINQCITVLFASGSPESDISFADHPFVQQLPDLVATGMPRELRGQRADGTTFPVEVLVTQAQVGEDNFYTCILRDITERKRAEEEVRKLHRAVEQSPISVVITDLKGSIEYVNPKFTQVTGYTAAEALGQNPRILKTGTTSPDAYRELWQTIMTGREWHGEFHNVKKNGEAYWEYASISPILDDHGNITHFLAVKEDVTERKQMENEMRRQKEYSEAMVGNSPVAIVTLDMHAQIVSWNPAAETLFGYKADEAVGQNIYDLVAKPGATPDEIRQQAVGFANQVANGKRVQVISQRTRRDGSLVDVEMLAVPVIVADEQVGIIVIYHDITDLQQARQQAEAASQAKSEFLATMSHEIRTPMNAIIGMSGLLLDTSLTQEQREFTETIRNSSDALLTIINEILDFSKIEASKLELEHQPFDLYECLEGALDLLAARAAEKGLDLAYLIDHQVPHGIVGDVTRLRQILVNLLSNAVKFTDKGEVVVSITVQGVTNSAPDDDTAAEPPSATSPLYTLHFSVHDTGIGIPTERIDRLFKSFSQVDASTTRQYGGTGLGLVISKRLSEIMGGTMWVESAGIPGQGSTFHFTITACAAPSGFSSIRPQGTQPQLRGKRLLIVDDNATNRRILNLQSTAWGMIPTETGSPLNALELVKRGEPFDIAILDMHMPDMDGLMLAKAIQRERMSNELPLVMLTSLGQRDEVDGAEQTHFAAYLTKPIKASQLYDTLVNVFEHEGHPTPVTRKAQDYESSFDATMAAQWPLRILLTEDNTVNQRLALLILERLGYRADVAGNGIEALDALQRQIYDVILMDVQMPEMDGLEATRRIRMMLPEVSQPYIIAMTANAMQGDREICLAAGMNNYVSKPINVGELVEGLKQAHTQAAASAPPTVAADAPLDLFVKPDPGEPDTPAQTNGASETRPEDVSGIIDPGAIKRLRSALGQQADAMLPGLIDAFFTDSDRLQNQARQALATGKLDELRRAAHSLKSNSANFGATTMTELCRTLEQQAHAETLEGAEDLLAQIGRAYEQARFALEQVRKEMCNE